MAIRTEIDDFLGTKDEQIAERGGFLDPSSCMVSKALMTCRNEIQAPFEAHLPHRFLCEGGSFLHESAQEIDGNDAHQESFVSQIGTLYGKRFEF